MKEKTVMKRCLALVLSFALVISGLTIPKGDVTVAEAAEETESATNIVGDEGATADNSEAKIGEAYFLKFANAVTQANQANGDVTIEVLKNISIGTLEKSVINTDADSMSGQIVVTKPVTIDGKGHTVTTYAKHTFKVAGTGGVNMRNMTLACNQQQSVIQVVAQATVNLEDIQINAISKSTGTEYYGYHLISLPESVDASEVTLNFTRVNVKMNSGSTSSWYGVVRTGNDSTIKRTININLDSCNWDLTEAPGRKAFAVCNGATVNLNMKDSTISVDGTTNASQIIATGSQAKTNLTKTNSKFNNETYEAQIGNTLCTFADAITQANSSSGATVEVLKDITIGTKENSILNEPNSLTGQISISKPVTIDGNGHTVTTYAKHTFKIGCAGEVNMCNMTLACNQQQSVMQVNAEATVNFTDVTINATSTSTGNSYYDYHIISLPESTNIKKQTLNFTRVNVTMGTPNTTGSWYGFIRTGNDNADILRTIDINLDSCNWDLTNASNRRAFVVLNGATVNLDIKDSTISTAGTASSQVVVNSSKGTTNLTKTNSVFNNATYEAQVGNDLCSLADAVSKASAGATIEILKDITISNISIAKKLTIDGNNHTITTTSGDAFIIQVADTVELNNMKLAYKSTGVAIRVKTPGADARLTNVDITSTANVEYTLINLLTEGDTSKTSKLTLTNVHVDMDTASNGNSYKAIIRTGNNPWGEGDGYVSCEKNVEITLKDCVLDASQDTETGAIDRYGIIIMSTTTAKVSMTNTQLYTHDLAPIKDLSGKADITVSDDCVIGCDTKDAQIGYTAVYSTLAEAITAVKETTTDVTIELLRDVTMDNCDVKNQNGKKITIDGKGYKLTTSGTAADGHAFRIYGSSDGTGTYEFKNMEIEHGKTGNLIQLRSDASPSNKKATVKLTKVDITNKNNGGYLYGLINMLPCGDDANTRLDLTDVDVTMKFDSDNLGTSDGAIIRTGNGHAADQKKTIDINLTNCNFDTTDAAKMRGILVHNYATANITIAGENSIKTKNVAPIEAYGNVTASTITLDGTCVFDSKTEEHKNTPIKGYDAQVGNVVYLRLADAVNVTNTMENATIELLQNIAIGTKENSVLGEPKSLTGQISISKPVTIDGNGHTVTTYAKHTFKIGCAGEVNMYNMTLACNQQQSVLQVNAEATVNFTDVTINATSTSTGNSYYDYHIISLPESTNIKKQTLNFTRVNVTMGTPNTTGSWYGFIRTGNDNADILRTIDINLDSCNWDLTNASNRRAFVVLNGATVNLDIKDSTISTAGTTSSQVVVNSSKGTTNLTKTNSTFNNATYDAQIGNTLCTFADAIKAVAETTTDVTIELLRDVTMDNCDVKNKNGKVIVIDGNKHKLTTSGTAADGHAFRIYGSSDGTGTYEFKNMKIEHGKSGNLIQLRSDASPSNKKAIVKLTNVDITNKNNGGYLYGLINMLPCGDDANTRLDLTDVDVTMKFDSDNLGTSDGAIIRTGNGHAADQKKTIDINLTNCNFDTTDAAKMRGILVHNYATANITIAGENSIKTKNVAPIEAYGNVTASTITLDGTCVFDSKTEEHKNTPIKGYDAKVGNVVYLRLADAVNVTNTMENATTELLRDITIGTKEKSIIDTDADSMSGQIVITKPVTIDGNNHTVTTYAKHTFKVAGTGEVNMHNMIFNCNQQQSVLQVAGQATVNLEDITINATSKSTGTEYYRYGLIVVPESQDVKEVTLNFTEVDVVMDTPAPSGSWCGVIRTGNDNNDVLRTININLDGCNWDLTKAPQRKGFVILNGTTANIDIKNSTISTDGTTTESQIIAASSNGKTNLTKTNCTWNNETYEAQIGNTLCTFAEAINTAKDSGSNATIELLKDITINACDIYNKNSKVIVIDGNNHTLTTEGTTDEAGAWGNAFRIYGSTDGYGTYEFKNMDIVHAKPGVLVQVHSTGDYTSKNATVKFTNVDITTKKENQDGTVIYGGGNYGLITTLPATLFSEDGITLDFTNVNVDMEVADNALGKDEDKAIIRTGNDGEVKTVTINLTGCNFDTTKASGVSGIVVMKNTHAKINLKDSTISTKDTYAIKVKKESGLDTFAMDNVNLTSNTPAYAQNPIYNSDGHEISNQSTDAFGNYRAEAYKDTTYKTYGGAKYFEKNGADAPLYSIPLEIVTAGNIFGGWYANEELKTALKMSDASSESTVWAKMVPNHVMSVKAQISKNLIDGDDTNNSTGTIRFVTTTDSLKYEEMGFRYSVVTEDGQKIIMSGVKSSGKVYEEIYALEENGEVMNYLPSIFCTESEYFKTLIFENVPSAYFTANITVQPFWITLDGTIVWGDEVTKTVQEGIDKTGWQSDNTTGFVPSNDEYPNRVILLSDLHYTTNLTNKEYMDNYGITYSWMTGPSYASGPAFGYSQSGKLGEALNDIDSFITAGNTIKSVMVLGDLTIDDFGYRDFSKDPTNSRGGYAGYLDDFRLDFMDVIAQKYNGDVSCYAIAGNHDSYTEDEWNYRLRPNQSTTLKRQYSVEIGNAVFIMLDTFKATTAKFWDDGGSGSEYKIEAADVTFLQSELAKEEYKDKTIFLCAHYYTPTNTTYDNQLAELIADDERIVCMFQGHTHINSVKNIEKLGGLPLVDIGGYAYNGSQADDGIYDFNTFDPAWAWGYQVLEWNDKEAHIYHVKNPRTYVGTNGTFNYKGAIENEMTFQFK